MPMDQRRIMERACPWGWHAVRGQATLTQVEAALGHDHLWHREHD